MNGRGRWTGMLTIVRFNWPYYAVAVGMLLAAVIAWWLVDSFVVRLACGCAMGAALWFLIGSLGAAHLTYDRSDLYRFGWVERALRGVGLERMVYCHCGFDDASGGVREAAGAREWVVLDHFDPERMTEASIARARALFPPGAEARAVAFDRWPVESESVDAVFGFLAIHELRREEERVAWFAEARRVLRSGGVIVLAEHLRDWANFAAFGGGYLHFHSRGSWERAWRRAGLELVDEFAVSAWVQVFVLRWVGSAPPAPGGKIGDPSTALRPPPSSRRSSARDDNSV